MAGRCFEQMKVRTSLGGPLSMSLAVSPVSPVSDALSLAMSPNLVNARGRRLVDVSTHLQVHTGDWPLAVVTWPSVSLEKAGSMVVSDTPIAFGMDLLVTTLTGRGIYEAGQVVCPKVNSLVGAKQSRVRFDTAVPFHFCGKLRDLSYDFSRQLQSYLRLDTMSLWQRVSCRRMSIATHL